MFKSDALGASGQHRRSYCSNSLPRFPVLLPPSVVVSACALRLLMSARMGVEPQRAHDFCSRGLMAMRFGSAVRAARRGGRRSFGLHRHAIGSEPRQNEAATEAVGRGPRAHRAWLREGAPPCSCVQSFREPGPSEVELAPHRIGMLDGQGARACCRVSHGCALHTSPGPGRRDPTP